VINRSEGVPWQYPPKREFIYGEWLRGECENGQIKEPSYDRDLAIGLAQERKNSTSLFGPDSSSILGSVPLTDIR
ncbi:aminoglycoside nucleotidyltransferase ANT9, partial [Staphylococcus aureus]